ncbi:dihydrodipicolinate synthase family protein [Limnohabitans sp. G3-2]|uniref:dihydrodipicolinate synthase family protein n=1 Tax=Limnohabitans sp. G3-2 TaxID=1100711 RepID=UPI000C1F867A|nr:dihydrodipicolinate synthase family protein [Limnohabitans sp. G3-2]PIT77149.1 dihydrodipicolinate synthase family protein [Limnohabitans sp. G3-2]
MTPSLTNSRNGFQGIWPAMLTPLDAQLNIDHPKLAAHALSLLAAGCGGVTIFGTTGEGPSFSLQERKQAVEQLIANGVPAARIMVSTSCAAVIETLELTRHAVDLGVHGCLVLPPFFFKGISDEGILNGYVQIIEGVHQKDWRLYLYHIPQVIGVHLPHSVIAELLKRYPGIVAGIKDSSCDRAHSVALAQAFMPPLTVYVGFEPDLPTMGPMGSTGAISGLANFMPRVVHRMVLESTAPGTAHDAQRVQTMLELLKPHSLMPALKSVMATLHKDTSWLRVRPPLVAMTPEAHTVFAHQVQQFHIDATRE